MTTITVPLWQDAPSVSERHDPTRVLHYVDAYWQRRRELDAAGRRASHSDFYDLPGIAGCSRPETPVYVLGQLYSLVERHDREAALVEQGYRRVLKLAPNEKRTHDETIVFAYHFVGAGSYERWAWQGARLVAGPEGEPCFVIPRGKRTKGTLLPAGKCAVYVKDGE